MSNALTHHRIMTLVAPFAQRGHHVDLAATDRLAGKLCFKRVDHVPRAGGQPACCEHLELETLDNARLRLTRRLETASGLRASLEIEGEVPDRLLAALDDANFAGRFSAGPNWLIAWRQKIVTQAASTAAPTAPLLIEADAEIDGTLLHMHMSGMAGVPIDVLFKLEDSDPIRLPDDFFAVLGWQWGTRLRRTALGWTTTLLIRGRDAGRHVRAQQHFECAVQHLARALSEPPAAFHRRWVAARWRVAAQRALPLAFCVTLFALTLLLPSMHIAADSSLRMLIFNAPPLLLVLAFSLRELPRIELPRRPRPSALPSWRSGNP